MGKENTTKDVRVDKEIDGLLPKEQQDAKPGKNLEIQLPDDIIEVIVECQNRTVILFFLKGIPSKTILQMGLFKLVKSGLGDRILRGLGKEYVSYMFKSTNHAQAILQYETGYLLINLLLTRMEF